MTAVTAQPVLTKTPDDVLPITASFVAELTGGDLLTGTPAVSVSPLGPSLSSPTINSALVEVVIPGNTHFAKTAQAVQFVFSGGTAGVTYSVLVTVSTVGGRTFAKRPITVVVSND